MVTTSDGIDVTLDSVECGLSTYEGSLGTETAIGQFCVVAVSLTNNSDANMSLAPWEFGGHVGEKHFNSNTTMGVSGFGDDGNTFDLNPELSISGVIVIDIAAQ